MSQYFVGGFGSDDANVAVGIFLNFLQKQTFTHNAQMRTHTHARARAHARTHACTHAHTHTLPSKSTHLHFNHEDRLQQSWLSSQHGCPHGAACGWDDLTPTPVCWVGVDGGVGQVEAHASQCFLAQRTLGAMILKILSAKTTYSHTRVKVKDSQPGTHPDLNRNENGEIEG